MTAKDFNVEVTGICFTVNVSNWQLSDITIPAETSKSIIFDEPDFSFDPSAISCAHEWQTYEIESNIALQSYMTFISATRTLNLLP